MHGPFCAQCGQETVIEVLRLKDFSHEYFQHFVTLESRLWRTLWTLVRYPGKLTTEFLAGRRRRYVRPLPLYVSLSFVLFLAMSFSPPRFIQLDELKDPDTHQAILPVDADGKSVPVFQYSVDSAAPAPDSTKQVLPELHELEVKLGLPVWLKPVFKRYYDTAKRWNNDPQGELKRFAPVFQSKLPYAAFALVPLFAVTTRLLYRKRQRLYAEHFLFALHLHALVFLTLLVATVVGGDTLAPVLYFGWMAYLMIALRHWMGGRWWPQALRAWAAVTVYSVCLILVLIMTMVLTLPTVQAG